VQHTPTVAIIGGGPAGSTAACLLAREGIDAVVLERERFPRYHIGESILPACNPILDLIGAREKVAAHGFRRKSGQYFHWGNETWDYRFGSLSGTLVSSYQVERSEFDKLLLDHAAQQGARVFEGRRVTEVHFDGDRPAALRWQDEESGAQGELEFDYLIDASGRAGVLANRHLGGRTVNETFRNVAVWGYWTGATELPHAPEGATVVSSVEDGWVWMIPLRDSLSVGVVLHKDRFQQLREQNASLEEFYQAMLERAPEVPAVLGTAKRSDDGLRVEQDYSYTSERYSGPRYFLAGDSACFLDPLLSTGVHLAQFSALLAAASIATLVRGELDEDTVARFYTDSYRRTYSRFLVVVAAVYRQYDGKDSYFWQAQRLMVSDRLSEAAASDSFLNVVTGAVDMAEITADEIDAEYVDRVSTVYGDLTRALKNQSHGVPMSAAEREQAAATAQYWNSFASAYSTSPQRAVNGLYVATTPNLGLRRLGDAPAAPGPARGTEVEP
jgi:flavin-dependent dehydrogenase